MKLKTHKLLSILLALVLLAGLLPITALAAEAGDEPENTGTTIVEGTGETPKEDAGGTPVQTDGETPPTGGDGQQQDLPSPPPAAEGDDPAPASPGASDPEETGADGLDAPTVTVKALPKLGAPAKGPGDPTYSVGLDAMEHGTVTRSAETAAAGATITLTPVPDTGYILNLFAVYTTDYTHTVDITASGAGFVFTMPAEDVHVLATFKVPNATYTVTFDPNGGEGTMELQTFTDGETWTIPECAFTPPEGKVFDSWLIRPVTGTQPEFPRVGNPGNGLGFDFDAVAQAQWKDAPAAPVTSYIFKGVSFELTGLNQLTSGSDAGRWMPAFPIDWTKFLVSIDPGADSAIPDSTLVEAHFDFLYTDAACTTILTGDMQDTGTYYLRLVVNNKNAEDHSIDYSSLAAENCSASVAGYTASFVSASATTFAGKDAVEVVFSVTGNSAPAVTEYPVWVGDTHVTSANKDDILGDGGKAKYDPDTNTLTLDNPTISGAYHNAAVYAEVDLTITGSATLSKPILVNEKDLTLDANIVIATPGWDCAIIAGNITVNGGSISASADEDALIAGSSITINDGSVVGNGCDLYAGSITIAGGTVNVSDGLFGIYSKNDITISGGTVTAKGNDYGIYAGGSVTISGGSVTAKATGSDSVRYGINGNTVSITGGTVTATSTQYAIGGTDISISGGTVTATGDRYGISQSHEFSITGGTLEATGIEVRAFDFSSITVGEGLDVLVNTEASASGATAWNGTDPLGGQNTVIFKYVKIEPGAEKYPVWVGGVQVTSANKDDILGDGTASFDPSTNTLTLNGLNVGDGYHASGASIVSTGIDLTVKGSATLSGGDYGIYVIETTEGGGNLTLDGADITYAVSSGSDTGIRADGNISISGGTIDVTAAKNGIRAGSSLTISGGSVTATGSECGISAAHGDVTIAGGTVNAKSDTVGIEATNGTIKIQNGTTSVTADGTGAAIGAGGITIGDEMMIKEPAGGFIGDITGSRVIKNPDDTTATHTVIVPKEAEKFPVAVVITTHDKDGHVISTVGGTATADKTEVAKGETITVTVTPNAGFELESIEFGDGVTGGYQLGKETSSTVPDDFTTGTGKLQIDVLFKETAPATTHTVTFETNGGTPVPAAQTVADGGKATKPADPTRSGFVFDGWYADATFAAAFDFGAPITADATVYAKWTEESKPGEIVYTIVSGGNSTWTKGSSSGVTIVVKRNPNDTECFSHFTSVQIDGTALVNGTDFSAVAGSTVITLNASALQKLTTGTKTVTINFDDGKATTNLTIKAGTSGPGTGTSPKTGDDSNPGLWLAVMMLSGLGLGGLVVTDKKRRYVSRH